MGNFSRDPQVRLLDSLAKRYVGVRLQQGVPLLDADWNELEDLRRSELETVGTWFVGDGVPVGSDGFHVLPVNADNDFTIRRGVCIVRGKVTSLDADARYSTQPQFGNVDLVPLLEPLDTPGAATEFVVYLDIWEREVDSREDGALIDVRLGMETTVRVVREWAVRVARAPEDLGILDSPPAGHVVYPLARLNRPGGNPRITAPMIEDLRDTQVSIRRRIEVRNNLGTLVVDNPRFRLLLETTRTNVMAFVRYLMTEFNHINEHMTAVELLGIQAAIRIIQPAEAGLALLEAQTLANTGALGTLRQLYEAENEFLEIWRDHVLQLGGTPKKYATYERFLDRLDQRLHDALVGGNPGLRPALEAGDLAAGTVMQDDIARLFSEAGASVPRGSLDVFLSRSPTGDLTAGRVVTFEFTVRSYTTLADTYTVDVLPNVGWVRRVVDQDGDPLPANRVPIGASPAEETIYVEVVVGTGTSGLQLRVTSDHNPLEVTQTTALYELTEDEAPPASEGDIRLVIDGVSPASADWDPDANTIGLGATGMTVIRWQAWNDSDESPVSVGLATAQESAVGTWTFAIAPAATVDVESHDFTDFQVRVTPGAGAATVTLVVSATATVDGSAVTAERRVNLIVT